MKNHFVFRRPPHWVLQLLPIITVMVLFLSGVYTAFDTSHEPTFKSGLFVTIAVLVPCASLLYLIPAMFYTFGQKRKGAWKASETFTEYAGGQNTVTTILKSISYGPLISDVRITNATAHIAGEVWILQNKKIEPFSWEEFKSWIKGNILLEVSGNDNYLFPASRHELKEKVECCEVSFTIGGLPYECKIIKNGGHPVFIREPHPKKGAVLVSQISQTQSA